MKHASTGLDGDILVLELCSLLPLLADHRMVEQIQQHYYIPQYLFYAF